MSWIFLDDLVEGMIKILDKAPPGRDYLMAGDVTTLRSLAERVCALGNVAPPRVSLPIGTGAGGADRLQPLLRAAPAAAPPSPTISSTAWNGTGRSPTPARRPSSTGTPGAWTTGLPPTVAFLQAS